MNAVEIEAAVSELASAPYDAAEFPFQFLAAFDKKETTLKRLRKGDSNKSDIPGAVLLTANQPKRWPNPSRERLPQKEVEFYLRRDLKQAFGNAEALFKKMTVKAIFKGVTYELLNYPQFMEAAHEALPLLELLHDEYKAAKAEQLALPKG